MSYNKNDIIKRLGWLESPLSEKIGSALLDVTDEAFDRIYIYLKSAEGALDMYEARGPIGVARLIAYRHFEEKGSGHHRVGESVWINEDILVSLKDAIITATSLKGNYSDLRIIYQTQLEFDQSFSTLWSFRVECESDEEIIEFGSALSDVVENSDSLRIHFFRGFPYIYVEGKNKSPMTIINRLDQRIQNKFVYNIRNFIYRQTVKNVIELEEAIISPNLAQFELAYVGLRVEPLEPRAGFQFVFSDCKENLRKEFLDAIEKSVHNIALSGMETGIPLTDMKVTLVNARCHDYASRDYHFSNAVMNAFRLSKAKFEFITLEPIMEIEFMLLADSFQFVAEQILASGGVVDGIQESDIGLKVKALVPLGYLDILLYKNIREEISFNQLKIEFHSYRVAPYSPVDDRSMNRA